MTGAKWWYAKWLLCFVVRDRCVRMHGTVWVVGTTIGPNSSIWLSSWTVYKARSFSYIDPHQERRHRSPSRKKTRHLALFLGFQWTSVTQLQMDLIAYSVTVWCSHGRCKARQRSNCATRGWWFIVLDSVHGSWCSMISTPLLILFDFKQPHILIVRAGNLHCTLLIVSTPQHPNSLFRHQHHRRCLP